MRYLFTIAVVLFCFAHTAYAANGGCGTVTPSNHQLHSTDLERSVIQPKSASRAAIRYVPVTYHIVTKDNGSSGITFSNVLETHCMLNTGFEEPQIYFYIHSIETINDDDLWAMDDGQGNTDYYEGYNAFARHNVDDVVNVYITGRLPGLCGFATYPGSAQNGGGIFLAAGCCGTGQQTIPHEMGHFLNLPHTFEQTNPVEYVTRTAGLRNCATKGDRFCDTEADPSESRAVCPYTGTLRDPRNDLYNPDESYFMSYFNDNCLSRFSVQQQNEMNSALTSDRPELFNLTTPDVTPLNPVTMISPTDADTSTISSNITFKWHSVPRAQYYLFQLRPSTGSLVLVDTLLTDTVFQPAGGLTANKTFKWFVRPISFGNVCESDAPYFFIKTTPIKAVFSTTTPTCTGAGDGTIQATPSNGAAPYNLTWSNGQAGNLNSNLLPGNYTVTITDNNGRAATASFVINDPAPVNGTITKSGNDLTVSATGGNAPYTYYWSDGTTGAVNLNAQSASYTVTISDANGCSTTETFGLTSAGIDLATKVWLKVFPNPAVNAAELNLQISLNEAAEATVSIINVDGAIVQHFTKQFQPGLSNSMLNIGLLPAGIYFVQFRAAEVIKTERVSIMR